MTSQRRHDPGCSHQWITRRRFGMGMGAAITLSLGGCLGDDDAEERPDPVDLGDGRTCDVCGMVIADHYGPSAQAFYAGDRPEGRDGPAWFDSIREMLAFDEEQRTRGWEPIAYYVTDYSTVEYTVTEANGDRYISSHTEPASFVDATEAVYVIDGPIQGAMGPDLHPFSHSDDAESFAAKEGGDVADWSEIRPD